jgi:hypothetical protein
MTRTVLPQKSPLTRSPTAPALSREGRGLKSGDRRESALSHSRAFMASDKQRVFGRGRREAPGEGAFANPGGWS